MAKQRYGQTQLESGYGKAAEQGGGIQPGAHPAFEQPTLLDKTVAGIKSVVGGLTRRINSSGSTRSPSTMRDRSNPKP